MNEEEQLNSLADGVALYFKALVKRNVPVGLAMQIVRDWQSAYVQDELDRRYRNRRDPQARPFRSVMAPDQFKDFGE